MHSKDFFKSVTEISTSIDLEKIEHLVDSLYSLRERKGRLIILGVGGSAGNAGHAVNDFRKLCGIETYAPTDNVSELTARTNDEGWDTVFVEWLKTSNIGKNDAILVFSVGGGDFEKNVSVNLIKAIDYMKSKAGQIYGIVGKEDGYTAQNADVAIVIPHVHPDWRTPLSEAFQAVVWHSLMCHPKLQKMSTKW